MKFINIYSLLSATMAMASICHPYYECCKGCEIAYTDLQGNWGIEDDEWCFRDEIRCQDYESEEVEQNEEEEGEDQKVQYHASYAYADQDAKEEPSFDYYSNAVHENFFDNVIYCNQDRVDRVQSSIDKLSGDLKKKAEAVQYEPTAIWLSWDKAPESVTWHLDQAGGQTAVFILYWIPTRDCNSIASQGGAQNMEEYREYVQRILKGFKEHPNSKIVLVIEPDTLGNMITSQSNELCKNVHNLHKQAIAYALDTLGSLDNVQAYIDAAHGRWLGPHVDKAAAIIKEITEMAPKGKLRGLSTNVSNYQPLKDELAYHEKLHNELEKLGLHDKKFIVDTARNGVDLAESLVATGTWCNVVGTGFGERPRGTPDPVNMPYLDAFMWLKPGGDSDGSSSGPYADPVCAHADSLPGAGNAGDWFHEYFVQLITNAYPAIEI